MGETYEYAQMHVLRVKRDEAGGGYRLHWFVLVENQTGVFPDDSNDLFAIWNKWGQDGWRIESPTEVERQHGQDYVEVGNELESYMRQQISSSPPVVRYERRMMSRMVYWPDIETTEEDMGS